jgi:hypothetical protein
MSPFLTHLLRCWVEMVTPGFIPSHNLLQETFPARLVSAENFHANPHPEVFLFVSEVLGHRLSDSSDAHAGFGVWIPC